MTVLVRIITLYGILKSGVGSGRSNDVVRKYTRLFLELESKGKRRMTAGATSKPRLASGGYSVYLRIAFSKS